MHFWCGILWPLVTQHAKATLCVTQVTTKEANMHLKKSKNNALLRRMQRQRYSQPPQNWAESTSSPSQKCSNKSSRNKLNCEFDMFLLHLFGVRATLMWPVIKTIINHGVNRKVKVANWLQPPARWGSQYLHKTSTIHHRIALYNIQTSDVPQWFSRRGC